MLTYLKLAEIPLASSTISLLMESTHSGTCDAVGDRQRQRVRDRETKGVGCKRKLVTVDCNIREGYQGG